jgi:hypothetical protein
MNGRAFLIPAEELATGPSEAHRRASAGRSYYALFQEALGALRRWGIVAPRRENIHAYVRLRFTYSTDAEARSIGYDLDFLVKLRNEADYDLATPGRFEPITEVIQALAKSRDAIALLDAIESDPIRRDEVVAAIRP